MALDFKIEGALEMERLLKELGPRAAHRAGTAALRAGAKPVVDAAKRKVAVLSGDMRDAIGVRSIRAREDGERAVLIGVRIPHSRRFHLLEFGTRFSAAQPFMRPALDENVKASLDRIAKVLARGIAREAAKLAKGIV